ncbi:MAG: helix-turn-helix domain-containing protein [Rhodanobacter sp.]
MPLNWHSFVATAVAGFSAHYLAAIVGQPIAAVRKARPAGSVGRGRASDVAIFADLFARWHGRLPAAADWPTPLRSGHGAYQWLPPEDELLASLVGRVGKPEISVILTERLRRVTGDKSASRNEQSVQIRINRLGMQTSDVVGGITIQQAGAEIGSVEIVRNAIRAKGGLKTHRLGRLIVIPHAEWERWKSTRAIAPPGYVHLASLRELLGISSDSKLPEFAQAGYIPTAIRCNPAKPGVHSGRFGTWYVNPKVARRLVADRHAGRPMPWHGKPLLGNLKHSHARWVARKHPASCATCQAIWGATGAPKTFADYCERYPPLAHGAKRHLTLAWKPGLTPAEVAQQTRQGYQRVIDAIQSGALRASKDGRGWRITQTDATRWATRKHPDGSGKGSWISIRTASRWYDFTRAQIEAFIADKRVNTRTSAGKRLVMRQQVAELRQDVGYTDEQAAAKVGVTVAALRTLLEGVHWRQDGLIPLVTVQAVTKRLHSQQGYTIPEAASETGQSQAWVHDRIKDGTIRITRARWDQRRLYITAPMLARLKRAALANPNRKNELSSAWITLGDAARLAGVSTATINNWRRAEEVRTMQATKGIGARFARVSVMVRARRYWQTCRFHRATPPEWLQSSLAITPDRHSR